MLFFFFPFAHLIDIYLLNNVHISSTNLQQLFAHFFCYFSLSHIYKLMLSSPYANYSSILSSDQLLFLWCIWILSGRDSSQSLILPFNFWGGLQMTLLFFFGYNDANDLLNLELVIFIPFISIYFICPGHWVLLFYVYSNAVCLEKP